MIGKIFEKIWNKHEFFLFFKTITKATSKEVNSSSLSGELKKLCFVMFPVCGVCEEVCEGGVFRIELIEEVSCEVVYGVSIPSHVGFHNQSCLLC